MPVIVKFITPPLITDCLRASRSTLYLALASALEVMPVARRAAIRDLGSSALTCLEHLETVIRREKEEERS